MIPTLAALTLCSTLFVPQPPTIGKNSLGLVLKQTLQPVSMDYVWNGGFKVYFDTVRDPDELQRLLDAKEPGLLTIQCLP